MMKQVMKRAWEIAKTGVNKFGGKVREYFAASLSIAWKEIKTMSNVIATFEKLDGKVQVEVTAGIFGGINVAINGEKFKGETKMVRGQWAYSIHNAKAAKLMERLTGVKLKDTVNFADDSAECANEKADQIRFDKLSASDKMNAVVQYGSHLPLSFGQVDKAESLKEVHELMTKNKEKLASVFEEVGGEVEYFTGGYHVSIQKSQLLHLNMVLKKFDAKRATLIENKNAEKNAKRAALIEKARETGEPQVLYTYTVDCPDDNEDCSFDSVTVTIDADGKIEKTQSHCW